MTNCRCSAAVDPHSNGAVCPAVCCLGAVVFTLVALVFMRDISKVSCRV